MKRDPLQDALVPQFAREGLERLRPGHSRLCYYTTADTALKIIKNREIWMRNASAMNDAREVQHGLEILRDSFREGAIAQLLARLERRYPGIAVDVERLLADRVDAFLNRTYITCLSMIGNLEFSGRLSMWRAYGGPAAVALVFRPLFLDLNPDVLGLEGLPVLYGEAAEFDREVDRMCEQVDLCLERSALSRDEVCQEVLWMLRGMALATKHPAFREETELRIVANPDQHVATAIAASIESVAGHPQRVLKIPLRPLPELGVEELDLARCLELVLIGPAAFPKLVRDALVSALEEAKVPNSRDRVSLTNIPLRTAPHH